MSENQSKIQQGLEDLMTDVLDVSVSNADQKYHAEQKNHAEAESQTSEILRLLLEKAQAGDVASQAELGTRYRLGRGVKINYIEAYQWLKIAADKEHGGALASLGKMFKYGQYVKKDEKLAAEYFEKSFNQGNAIGQIELGFAYLEGSGVKKNENLGYELCQKAIESLYPNAEKGDTEAQHALALCYKMGFGVQKDTEKALEWWRRASDLGCAYGQYNLGRLEKDKKIALDLLSKAAEQGHMHAQFLLAVKYAIGCLVTKDIKKACELLEQAANQGHRDAQFVLAKMYYCGDGVPKNVKLAYQWLKEAADRGQSEAQFRLSHILYSGQGVVKDVKKAAEWLKKAADNGLLEAQFELGRLHLNGTGGVTKDAKRGCEWLESAAKQGHLIAQAMLARLYYNGDEVDRDLKKALEFAEEASSKNDNTALAVLGDIYYRGAGVPKDVNKGRELLEKSANQGYISAQVKLGTLYCQDAAGNPEDSKKGLEWLEKAANRGNTVAQHTLGRIYYYGQGFPRDFKKALEWLEKAATLGDAASQFAVGVMYDSGQGVSKDQKIARNWFQKSAEQGQVHDNTPAILWAAKRGIVECLAILAEKGTNLNIKDSEGNSPLMLALMHGQLDYARALVEFGAEVNSQNNLGRTPLHILASNGALNEFIPFLLQNSENLSIKDAQGLTPLQLAENSNKTKTVQLLKIIQIIKPCFNPGHLQLLANLIEHCYLICVPEDYLLLRCREFLTEGKGLIHTILEQSIEELFSQYSKELQAANEVLKLPELQTFLIEILQGYLKVCYLYPRQIEVFCKPYIDTLLYKANDGNDVLEQFLIKPEISKIVLQYCHKDLAPEIIGFSNNNKSPCNSDQAKILSEKLNQARIKWVMTMINPSITPLINLSPEPQSPFSSKTIPMEIDLDAGDTKRALDSPEIIQLETKQNREAAVVLSTHSPLLHFYKLTGCSSGRDNVASPPPRKKQRIEGNCP